MCSSHPPTNHAGQCHGSVDRQQCGHAFRMQRASACYAFTDESGQVEMRVTVGAVGRRIFRRRWLRLTVPKTGAGLGKRNGISQIWRWSHRRSGRSGSDGRRLHGALAGNASAQRANAELAGWHRIRNCDPGQPTTDGDGYARSTVHTSKFTADLQGTVCLAPGNNPVRRLCCASRGVGAQAQPVWGGLQTIGSGYISADLGAGHNFRDTTESGDGRTRDVPGRCFCRMRQFPSCRWR